MPSTSCNNILRILRSIQIHLNWQGWVITKGVPNLDLFDEVVTNFRSESSPAGFKFSPTTPIRMKENPADRHFCLTHFSMFGYLF